jgi:hypothetical protein
MNDVNITYDVFLSYNSQDHAAVEVVARHLESQGLTVFLDRWYLVAGTPWPERLEQILTGCRAAAIFLGPNGMGRWQQREQYLALDRQARSPDFSVIPILLPGADPALGFLSLNTWVDLRRGVDDVSLTLLTAAVRGQAPGPDLRRRMATALASICPYRGLRFFREEDAPFFFGRDAFIARLVSAVDQHALVAVVGASGSGKSSVVRAGLVPRLRRKDGKMVWDIATMLPGDRPLQSLAAAIVPLIEPEMTEVDRLREVGKLAAAFRAKEISLRDTVARALVKQPGTDRLMLVVDQWEELYTQTRDEDARQRFLEEVVEATTAGGLSIVLTLRGDFFDQVINYRPLSERLQAVVSNISPIVNISRMDGEELRQVIERPAQKVGLTFQPGLVKAISDKVEGRPGSLPLLEFVLMELWKKQQDGLLTHGAYETLGEIEGAIAVHAESVFMGLTQPEREIARRVFLRLVRPGVETDPADPDDEVAPTRRRASFAELGADSLPVVRRLADAHLLVTGRNEATGEEIVDLVHEALISAWGTLSKWIEDDRTFLIGRERLRALMSIAAAKKYEKGTLLQGSLLAEAREWLQTREPDLSPSEQQYINTSIKARKAQLIRRTIIAMLVFIPLAAFGIYLANTMSHPGGANVNGNGQALPSSTNANLNHSPEIASDQSEETLLPRIEDVKLPSGVVTIPVVVHVVYRTEVENISDAQVKSQIDALNRDFRARNDDLTNVPAPFKEVVGDAHIEFTLATTDPEGKPTNGITRTKTSQTDFSNFNGNIHFSTRGGVNAWPAEKYLNVWVCNLGDNGGYTSLPSGPKEQDGVVENYRLFGTTGPVKPPFHLGRQMTHEIGHYLNLRHLWGDKEDCRGTDSVEDTPPQQGPNFGKPSFPHVTCNNGPNGDMFMNFMDYADDEVRCMFTKGQVLRMHQTLQGARKGLAISHE